MVVKSSSTSSSKSRMNGSEKFLNVLKNTKANETIVAIDTEAGLDKLIGVGIAIFQVSNLIKKNCLSNIESKRFKLLHESQKDALLDTPFWSDKQQLADDLINNNYPTEDEMYTEESNRIKAYLESIILSAPNVKFLVGTTQDIYYLARIRINLQMLVEFSRGRVIILDMFYRGKISTFDTIKDERDNPYTVIRNKFPVTNSLVNYLKGKLGKTELHDCIDDCKVNIILYLAFMVGSSQYADKLRAMINF
mgnify:CR=1 FL=1